MGLFQDVVYHLAEWLLRPRLGDGLCVEIERSDYLVKENNWIGKAKVADTRSQLTNVSSHLRGHEGGGGVWVMSRDIVE